MNPLDGAGSGAIAVAAPSLGEVLNVFNAATQIKATSIAGSLLAVCVAVGTVLILGWLLQVGSETVRGGWSRAPQVLLLIVAAFIILLLTLGVFYQ